MRYTNWSVSFLTFSYHYSQYPVCSVYISSQPDSFEGLVPILRTFSVPVRNTDFSHLRDGFTRAIQQRAKLARTQSRLSDEEEQRINEQIQELKSLFPTQSVPKGKALDLIRDHRGDLTIEYEVSDQTPWLQRIQNHKRGHFGDCRR